MPMSGDAGIFMIAPHASGLLRQTLALLPPLVAAAVQWLFWSYIQPYVWFLFYPAVFVSSWIGGLGAGLRATLLATALVWWFFIPPAHAFLKHDLRYLCPATVFIAMGVLFSMFHERLRKAHQRAADALAAARAANDELQGANAKITRLYEQTRELDDLKSQFFAGASHELRTPLALILGPAERLLASARTPREARADLEVIVRNARTLLRHVNDLLDVSKLEAARMHAEYAQTDVARLARFVAGHFETLASDKHIAFGIDIPPELQAQVDPDKLRRVLLNLLSNAFKFTSADGRVRLALRERGDRLIIEVADKIG